MKLKIIFIYSVLSVLLVSCNTVNVNTKSKSEFAKQSKERYFRFMAYNVENLFDTHDDPEKNDEEFLPDQGKYWTYGRYMTKLQQIYQVMVAVGEWDLPDAVAFCEVENRFVLDQLIQKTPLYKSDYKIIHYESPDARGIDVAFLYRESRFKPIVEYPVSVNFPNEPNSKTRDILYIKGATRDNDTIHFFINHWPSRWGGQMETEHKRMFCAQIVKTKTDSILKANPSAYIILGGDFNDYPTDKSVVEILQTQTKFDDISNKKLYNLTYYLQEIKKKGTLKFHGAWEIIDQIVVSGALLDKTSNLYTTLEDAHVYESYFLLEDDLQYTGKKPFRTYVGYKYIGGYSDHLPVYLDLYKRKD